MSYRSKAIDREIFSAVPETCPKVDAALEVAAEAIKQQTTSLREALREYAERALNAEDELEEAKERIKELDSEVAELRKELENLK